MAFADDGIPDTLDEFDDIPDVLDSDIPDVVDDIPDTLDDDIPDVIDAPEPAKLPAPLAPTSMTTPKGYRVSPTRGTQTPRKDLSFGDSLKNTSDAIPIADSVVVSPDEVSGKSGVASGLSSGLGRGVAAGTVAGATGPLAPITFGVLNAAGSAADIAERERIRLIREGKPDPGFLAGFKQIDTPGEFGEVGFNGVTAGASSKLGAATKGLPFLKNLGINAALDVPAAVGAGLFAAKNTGQKISAKDPLVSGGTQLVNTAIGALLGKGKSKAKVAPEAESPAQGAKVPETASNEAAGASVKPSAEPIPTPKADPELAKADQFMNFKRTRFSPETETTVRKRIVEWAKTNGEDPKTVEPLEEIEAQAANVGLSRDFIEKELKPAAKGGIPRAQMHAARTTHTELSEKYATAQQELDAKKHTMAPAEIEAAERNIGGMRADLMQLEDVILPARTAAGRNLRALAMEVGLTTDPSRQVAKAKKVKGGELTQQEYDKLQGLTKAYNEAKKGADPDAIRSATGELVNFHQGLQRTDLITATGMTIKAAMLSGLKTVGRNLGSNTAHQALMAVEDSIAGPVDWALSLITKQRTKLAPWEKGNAATAMLEAARRSGKDAVDTFKYGAPVGQLDAMLKKYDMPRSMNTGHKVWDTAVNSVFRATAAQDLPAWHYAYIRGIEEQARLIAKNEQIAGKLAMPFDQRVKQIVQKPDTKQQLNAMVAAAEKVADRATFKGDNKLAEGITGFKQSLRSGGTGAKVGALATDLLMPFEKIPTNIGKEIGTRGGYAQAVLPFQAAKTGYKALIGKLDKDEQRAFTELFAKAGTGTGLIALGWTLGAKGLATGTFERDAGKRDRDELAGRQPESLRIGDNFRKVGDMTVPGGPLLALGAALQREWSSADTSGEAKAGKLATAAADTVLDQPVLTGAKNISRVFEPGGFQRLAGTMASMPVPTIVGDIAAVADGTRRDAKAYSGESTLEGVKRSVKQEIPGIRQSLPPRLNSVGKEQPEPWTNLFDPTLPKRVNKAPYVQELVKYDVPLPRIDKLAKESREEYQQRQQVVGKKYEEQLAAYVNTAEYKAMTPDMKRYALKKVVAEVNKATGELGAEARNAAKDETMRRQLPSLFQKRQ